MKNKVSGKEFDCRLKNWKWPFQRINFGGSTEYACPHGIGHGGVHGCDGCCDHPSYKKEVQNARRTA
jgi:hypothetical protein